jgi:hypothetical protein
VHGKIVDALHRQDLNAAAALLHSHMSGYELFENDPGPPTPGLGTGEPPSRSEL